jgi:hypothetical protein
MTVWIIEIQTATIIPMIDVAPLFSEGIGPILDALCLDTLEDCIKLRFTDQKREMPLRNNLVNTYKIEGRVVDLDHRKVSHDLVSRMAENVRVKLRRLTLVLCNDDGVIQRNSHYCLPLF